MGHLNNFPAVGHLSVYFQKILIPGVDPGGGGGGWAVLELTDALLTHGTDFKNFCGPVVCHRLL